MKLRVKLLSSFGAVAVAVLVVFGVIVYLTFAESIRKNQDQLLTSRVKEISLHINTDLLSRIEQVRYALTPLLVRDDVVSSQDQTPQLTFFVAGSDLFSALAVFDSHGVLIAGSDTLATTVTGLPQAVLADETQQSTTGTFPGTTTLHHVVAIEDNGAIFLAFPKSSHGEKTQGMIAAQIDMGKLKTFIEPYLGGLKTLVAFFHQGKLLLTVNGPGAPSATVIPSQAFLATTGGKGLLPIVMGDTIIYPAPEKIFGLQMSFLFSGAVLSSDLATLKNRVIAAVLIMTWLAIWVILIVAYMIARPITNLSLASKKIVAMNYEEALDHSRSGIDEMDELEKNFETMRLRIRELIMQDPLTKTYNRRHLMLAMEMEISRAVRTGTDFSCVLTDIDFFKRINDNYGHICGDVVLQAFATVMKGAVRNYDTVARYGGEEFVLLFPNTTEEVAYELAERIRKKTEKECVVCGGAEIRFTTSLGVATFDHENVDSPSQLLEKADRALYRAKHSGRNKTVRDNE